MARSPSSREPSPDQHQVSAWMPLASRRSRIRPGPLPASGAPASSRIRASGSGASERGGQQVRMGRGGVDTHHRGPGAAGEEGRTERHHPALTGAGEDGVGEVEVVEEVADLDHRLGQRDRVGPLESRQHAVPAQAADLHAARVVGVVPERQDHPAGGGQPVGHLRRLVEGGDAFAVENHHRIAGRSGGPVQIGQLHRGLPARSERPPACAPPRKPKTRPGPMVDPPPGYPSPKTPSTQFPAP